MKIKTQKGIEDRPKPTHNILAVNMKIVWRYDIRGSEHL